MTTRPRFVVLSGPMGAGKSTVGRALASRLSLPWVDTDLQIEVEAGLSVEALWREEGEAGFRRREEALIHRLLDAAKPSVVSLGGGGVLHRPLRRRLLEETFLCTLHASVPTLAARVQSTSRTRPLLSHQENTVAQMHRLLTERAEAYAECHASVCTDTLTPEQVAEKLAMECLQDRLVMPLGLRSYVIEITHSAPHRLARSIEEFAPSSLVVVTDSQIQAARGASLAEGLAGSLIPRVQVVLPPGEMQKTQASVSHIWDAALHAGIDRHALVVAFGGGVVGDLAGFSASTLLRGIRVLQVPTTLLGMVDASVGGKTGFNHAAGKNLLGTFHPPCRVLIDLDHLSTLPEREYRAAFAEIIKISLVADATLFAQLEVEAPRLLARDPDALASAVRRAVKNKVRIVQEDEREEAGRLQGRMLLNLGHTVGHALEAHGGYSRYLHGEAVALGLLEELTWSIRQGITPQEVRERTLVLLTRFRLPTFLLAEELRASAPFFLSDKKRRGDTLPLPVVTRIGAAEVVQVPLATLHSMHQGPWPFPQPVGSPSH